MEARPSGAPSSRSSIGERVPQPELPVELSQVVVVGKIVSITPWMVTGNVGIYSEYLVEVNSLLMNHSSWEQAGTLDLVGLGGVAQMEHAVGIFSHFVSGAGHQIEAGNTYILFLKYQPPAQCFTFVKVWEVRDDHVVAVSSDDLSRVKRGASTVNGLSFEQVVGQIQKLVSALAK